MTAWTLNEEPGRRRPRQRIPSARGVVLALVLVIVLTQRLAFPIGPGQQLPASLPLAMIVVAIGLATGSLTLNRTRTELYCVAVGTLVALTVLSILMGRNPSMLSIGLVVALYAFATLQAPGLTADDVAWILDAFVTVMVGTATIGLLQMAVQFAGVPLHDWLGFLPRAALLEGYNTGDPISWGSHITRVNGALFLEPSFFSYFLGLAACVSLHRGRSVLTLSLLLVAIVPTLAGSGVVLLLAGVVALALGRRSRNLRILLLPLCAAVTVAFATPIADRFLQRLTEVGVNGSSSSLRLVEPYQRLLPAWLPDPWGVILGHGAGSATDLIGATRIGGLLVPVLPKLLLEYGVVGTSLFLWFFLWSLLQGPGERPWTAGLLVCYLVLNASFLQVTLALNTIVFIHLLRDGVPDLDHSSDPPLPSDTFAQPVGDPWRR